MTFDLVSDVGDNGEDIVCAAGRLHNLQMQRRISPFAMRLESQTSVVSDKVRACSGTV